MTKAIPPSRQTKKVAARRAAQPAPPWPLLLIGLGTLAVVGIVAFATYQTVQQRTARTAPIPGVQSYADPGAGHVTEPVTYDVVPPIGGPHYAEWQNCGIYDQPVENENAVHSLEHGAVWITYRPDLPADQVARLRDLVRGRSYALLSPYPSLPAPVVASAWGLQLRVESASDERLSRFLVKYMQGPQTPEPGAVCYAGVGTPIAQ